METLITQIKAWFSIPSLCIICQEYHNSGLVLCTECINLFPRITSSCAICAYPLSTGESVACGECLKQKPYYDKVYANYLYEEPLRSILQNFKYHRKTYYSKAIARLILNTLPPDFVKPDLLIPVPMHKNKLKRRGFSHSARITQLVGAALNIPYALDLGRKTRDTQTQASLSGDLRKNNLDQAFEFEPIEVKHLVIVDDLITTGSTLNAMAKLLKAQGVEVVEAYCCARALQV